MIAIFSPGGNSLAVDSRRPLQFTRALFIAVGYQLGVLVRIASSKIERRFAIFADIPTTVSVDNIGNSYGVRNPNSRSSQLRAFPHL